jgi:hypothetical protein
MICNRWCKRITENPRGATSKNYYINYKPQSFTITSHNQKSL